jgi:mRNA interferase MazF
LSPGDVVIGAFPGARITKTRPAVVLSTAEYHRHRPDVIPGLVTTKSPDVLDPTDCEIREWRSAGLHAPSCFRLYVITLHQRAVRTIGRLSDDDWKSVQRRLGVGLAVG